jgi:hypothetical protein
MLISVEPEPQILDEAGFAAAVACLSDVGDEYEGVFTGVGAGASVYHFHVHFHKGASVIWRNLENGVLSSEPIIFRSNIRLSLVNDWPAPVLLFETADIGGAAPELACILRLIGPDSGGYGYNVGFRLQEDRLRLLIVPRRLDLPETPPPPPEYPHAWGKFAFLEMTGSIFVLEEPAFDHILKNPSLIRGAIAALKAPADDLLHLCGQLSAGV